MLSTTLSTIFLILTVCAVATTLLLYRKSKKVLKETIAVCNDAYENANMAFELVKKTNTESVSLAKLTEHDTAILELTDSFHAIQTSIKKLRGRLSMRQAREKGLNDASDGEIPNSVTDPDGYKRYMRLKLRKSNQL